MNPPDNRRRRDGPGRRESDRLYDSLCRELSQIRDALKGAVQDLRDLIKEVDDELQEDLDELDEAVKRVDKRLTDVEIARIEDTARTTERVTLRMKRNERRIKTLGIIGTVVGIIGGTLTILTLVHVL